MNDYNLCENCNEYHHLDEAECGLCGQPLVLNSKGAISVWRLGDIEDGVIGPILAGIRRSFGRKVVLQPSYIREDLSDRSTQGWNGISATVFLNQVDARHAASEGAFLSLGITKENIVPSSDYNFLFGYAFEDAAVMSLAPLEEDEPERDLLVDRAVKIAVHELGHGLGLDHHGYEDGVECTMVGDEEVDDLDTVDEGTAELCRDCRKVVAAR